MTELIGGIDYSNLRQSLRDELGATSELVLGTRTIPLLRELNPFKYPGNPILASGPPGSWDQHIHATQLYQNHSWHRPWRIYYTGRNNLGHFAIGFADALNPEGPYTKYTGNPIIVADQPWEKGNYVAALAMLQPEKNKYIGYYGFMAKASPDGFWGMDSALGIARVESTDGIAFTNKQIVLSRDPLIAEEVSGVSLPMPIYDVSTGKYYLLCVGWAPLAGVTPFWYTFVIICKSNDGIHFTKVSTVPMFGLSHRVGPAPNNIGPTSIVKLGGHYVMLAQTHSKISTGHGTAATVLVSRNLLDWFQFPHLIIWGTDDDEDPHKSGRYSSVCLVDRQLYVVYIYQRNLVPSEDRVALIRVPMEGPPFKLELYTENTGTKWAGLTTSAPVTSHRILLRQFSRKTLLFQSNSAGTLAIQIYVGGAWREWASITLAANKLEVYNLNGEVPMARCVYTPVGTGTIAVAEWMLAED